MNDQEDFFPLEQIKRFEWSRENVLAIWMSYEIKPEECEQVFVNRPLLVQLSYKSPDGEQRYVAMAQTNANRHLLVLFTVHHDAINVLFARDQSVEERKKKKVNGSYTEMPALKNVQEEQNFWSIGSSTEYIDWSKSIRNAQFPNLKLSSKKVDVQIPKWMLSED